MAYRIHCEYTANRITYQDATERKEEGHIDGQTRRAEEDEDILPAI